MNEIVLEMVNIFKMLTKFIHNSSLLSSNALFLQSFWINRYIYSTWNGTVILNGKKNISSQLMSSQKTKLTQISYVFQQISMHVGYSGSFRILWNPHTPVLWKGTNFLRQLYSFQPLNIYTVLFYLKWPFVRVLGVQEPASALFSFLNVLTHGVGGLMLWRRSPPNAPLLPFWLFFSAVCMNGFFWSILFHTRDFPFTELMDYASAFTMNALSLVSLFLRWVSRHISRI